VGAATLAIALVLIVFRRFVVISAKTYRCNSCKQCWPDDDRFTKCPACKVICWKKSVEGGDLVPTVDEALQTKSYIDFDAYYKDKIAKEHLAAIDRLTDEAPLYVEDVLNTA
jgi:hypothetical protein